MVLQITTALELFTPVTSLQLFQSDEP